MADQKVTKVVVAVAITVAIVVGLSMMLKCNRCGGVGCDCDARSDTMKTMRRRQMASGRLSSPSMTITPYGGRPPVFQARDLSVPGEALYAGYGGVNMNDMKSSAENQMFNYHSFDDAYSGLSLKQLAQPHTQYKTIIDNDPVLKYGVMREMSDDSMYAFFGPAQPIDNNPLRLVGVL